MDEIVVSFSIEEFQLLVDACVAVEKLPSDLLKEAGLMYAEVILDPMGNYPFGEPKEE